MGLLTEKKPFVFYEFLMFFWKKKIYFIIIPLIFTLLGFGGSYIFPNKTQYVGNSTVFTGSIKLKAMTDPSNVVAQFSENVDGEIDAFVSSESYIKIKVFSDDKDELTKDLNDMTDRIENALLENYETRLTITEEHLKSLEDREKVLSEARELYLSQLSKNNLAIDDSEEYTQLLAWTEGEITEARADAQSVRNDLAFFEKPSVIRNEVQQTKTYRTELTIAGFALGVFMTFLILSLWKYILDARRYYAHD